MNMNQKDMTLMCSTICKHVIGNIDDKFVAWDAKNDATIEQGNTVIQGLLDTINDMARKMDEMKAQIDQLQAGKTTKKVKKAAKPASDASDSDSSDKPKSPRKKSGYIRYGMAMRAKAALLDPPPKISISQFGQMWRAEPEEMRNAWNAYAKEFELTDEGDWNYTGETGEPTCGDVTELLGQIGASDTMAAATAPPKPIDEIEAVGTKESKFYKMADLRAELERRGLDGGGRKADKIERLKQAMRAEKEQSEPRTVEIRESDSDSESE